MIFAFIRFSLLTHRQIFIVFGIMEGIKIKQKLQNKRIIK